MSASGKLYGTGVILDSAFLDNLNDKERIELVKEYVLELGGQTFTAFDNNGKEIDVTIATKQKRYVNKSGKRVSPNKDLRTKNIGNKLKQETIVHVDELIETASHNGNKKAKYSHGWLDDNGNNDWEYWTTYVKDKSNNVWKVTMNIANANNGEKVLYDIDPIKKVERAVKSAQSPPTNSIPQNSQNATRKSLKIGDIEKDAIKHFGVTDSFRLAGYILRDGRMLDFSGAHWLEGESEEYVNEWRKKNDIRQVDHEDIYEVMEASGDNRKQFMDRGNIRIVPEAPGLY